jgi:hypothetical protein
MSALTQVAALASAVLLSSVATAWAEDNEAGVPLAPGEAAGAWTLESGGKSICVINLGAGKIGSGAFRLEAPANCAGALPPGLVGWTPAPGGMNLVGADGQTLLGFGRWSNSLFVSHRSSGEDVQLRRGT